VHSLYLRERPNKLHQFSNFEQRWGARVSNRSLTGDEAPTPRMLPVSEAGTGKSCDPPRSTVGSRPSVSIAGLGRLCANRE